MDVSEILYLLATQSIGLDDPTDSDIVVFMRFINLVYIELLQEIIVQNPLLPVLNEKLDCTNGILSVPSKPIFFPRQVYNTTLNKPLIPTIVEKIISVDPNLTQIGIPNQWYYANGSINVYPITTSLLANNGGFGFRYIPEPSRLTKNSKSTDILIPSIFQQILADGAAYYVFQSETGFRDDAKMKLAEFKWKKGKLKLFAYMKNISGNKNFSTFSYV